MTNDGPPLTDQNRAGLSWWNALTKRSCAERRESHSGDHPQTILVIRPAPKAGRFLGCVGDDLIVNSRQPFLDGARELLKRGYDPSTPYNMRHANSATPVVRHDDDRTGCGIERRRHAGDPLPEIQAL